MKDKDFDFYRAKYIRDGKWRIEFFDKDKKYVGSIYKVGSDGVRGYCQCLNDLGYKAIL